MFEDPRGQGLTYESFLEFVHPDDRKYVDENWQAALRQEREYDIEHPDGRRAIVSGGCGRGPSSSSTRRCRSCQAGFRTGAGHHRRKAAEAALAESESRVRRKLDAILTPEGRHRAARPQGPPRRGRRAVDDERLLRTHARPDEHHRRQAETCSSGSAGRPVCLDFHRANAETCKHCQESDLELTAELPPGESKLYRCKNGMWDMASPLFLGGKRVGGMFTGAMRALAVALLRAWLSCVLCLQWPRYFHRRPRTRRGGARCVRG